MNKEKESSTIWLFILIFFSGLLMSACAQETHVYVRNQTMDNFRMSENGAHLPIGEERFLATLNNTSKDESFFQICRSVGGCMAFVTVKASKFPEEGDVAFNDWIIVTEGPRNTFFVNTQNGYVTASISQ